MPTKITLEKENAKLQRRVAKLEKQLATCMQEKSEERFRSLFEYAPVAYQSLDEQGYFLDVNPAYCKLVGYSVDELIGKCFSDLWTPATRTVFPQAFEHLKQHDCIQAEFQLVCQAGTVVEVALNGSVQRDGQGRFICTHCILHDVTDRKQAEEKLRLVEQRYRVLIENAPDGIVAVSTDGKFKYASPSVEKIFGYTQAESLQKNPNDLTHPDDLPMVLAELVKVIENPDYTPTIHYRFLHKNGEWLWTESTFSNLLALPSVEAIIINFRDITERKLAEEKLRESEHTLQTIFDLLPVGVSVANQQRRVIKANAELGRILGLSPDQLVHGDYAMRKYLRDDGREMPFEELPSVRAARGKEAVYNFPVGIVKENGEIIWASVNAAPLPTGDILIVTNDITQHKHAEEKLRASEQRLRTLVTSLDDIVFQVDEHGTYLEVWTANEALLVQPRDHIIGRRFDEIFGAQSSRPFFDALARVLASGKPETVEYTIGPADDQRWFAARYNPIHAPNHTTRTVSILVRDITERKQAEREVRESRELFQMLFDFSPMAYALAEAGGAIIDINPACENLFGIPKAEVFGKPVSELDFWADPKEADKATQQFVKNGKLSDFEFAYKEKSGKTGWVLSYANLIHQGKKHYVLSAFVDITERKLAEQKLGASEERYRQAISAADAIPYALDYATNQYTFIGEGVEKLTGIPASEISVEKFMPLYIESAVQGDLKGIDLMQAAQLTRIGKTGGVWKCDHHIRARDGQERWISDSAVQVLNDQGIPVGSIGILQDITEHKATEKVLEERIKQATAEIQDLYDNAPAGYHSLDANGNFLLVNQTELNWLGYSREEMIGHPFTDFVTNEGITIFKQNFPDFMQRGWLQDLEMNFKRKDGTRLYGLVNATAIKDTDGNYLMSRSTLVDITERKRAEEVMQRANQEMERAMRLKDEFLANMSHELRTPLNAILGLAEGLLDQYLGTLNEKQVKSVTIIETSGNHLLSLINDILDLSKIEAGKMTLEVAPVTIESIAQASLGFIKEMAQRKNIMVNRTIDTSAEWVMADDRRLKQMIVNLLTNAVKFTPEGGRIGLDVMGDAENKVIHFSVRDNGMGIAPIDLARLFKPFVQVESGMTRSHEGTGLGLSLVARMAEMHGGSVSVESQVGQGSHFTITLPWTDEMQFYTSTRMNRMTGSVEPLKTRTIQPISADAPLILIVEDNESNIVTLSMNLEARGYRLAIARHGGQSLDRVRVECPAVILMDLQMPVMDGLEAIRRLRQESDSKLASVPIIALTALAMPGDRERALAAGANGYLSKPVNLKELIMLIDSLITTQ